MKLVFLIYIASILDDINRVLNIPKRGRKRKDRE